MDLGINHRGHVAIVEIQRPPNNFFDTQLILDLVEVFSDLDRQPEVRASVLCADGKNFCAGNDFSKREADAHQPTEKGSPLYAAAVELFACKKPIVGAIQGAAVGGGFGLALVPDFRVVSAQTRMTANFVKLGFHPGFGLTHTLPRLIGEQKAAELFLTGKRITGEEAYAIGLADRLVDDDSLRDEAIAFAEEIAVNAPLAIMSVRATLRDGLADAVRNQTDHEFKEQSRLQKTNDFREGIRAVAERRAGNFTAT